MTNFQIYQKKKSLCKPWLQEIPKHWHECKLKYLFIERSQKGFPTEPLLAATQTQGVVTKKAYGNRTVEAMKDLHLLKLALPGDFVISLRSFQGGIEYAHDRGIISPAYTILIPSNKVAPSYYRYLFKSQPFLSLLKICVTGIREGQNINYNLLKQINMPLPPYFEQEIIGRFLGYKGAQINKFIQKKKRLIELLKEQKQAIINQTVTRGLDHTVQLKSNRDEWFGNIPAHWEARKLKTLTNFQNGFAFKPSDWKASGIPIIRIQNLNGSNIFNYAIDGKFNAPRIDETDLLFAWSGNRGTSFGSFMWNRTQPGYLNQHIFKLTDFDLDRLFFYFALRAVTSYVEQKANGIIGMVHITKSELGSIAIPIPPKNEQQAIGQYLKQKTEIINHNISNIEKQIALIQEYRTRLISDVVTGQIDVRNIEISDIVDEELIEEALQEEQEVESLELVGTGDDD